MFNEQDQAREAGNVAALTLSFHDPLSPYESYVNSAESLIDYVAQRMSGAERAQ